MIEINEKNHTSTVISSLNKIYNLGKINGKLDSINLYILNIIYKLLDGCCLHLTSVEIKQLLNLYNTIYFYSSEICHNNLLESYNPAYKPLFFQAETTDCNNYPVFENIYYWQETNTQYNIGDVALLIPVDECFAILDTLPTDTYKIYDIINNDITHMFEKRFVNDINTILFMSNSLYSHSITNIKIKKTTDIFDIGVFNNIFNNIFN